MKKISIVYFSANGSTRAIADNVRRGAIESDVECLVEIAPEDITHGRYVNSANLERLTNSDAIVFGSPTYMGSPAGQFKSFMDATSDCYVTRSWRNKIAAGFTVGGSLNGEQQQTLLSFFTLACQHCMLWAGLDVSEHTRDLGLNRTGSSIGLVASVDATTGQIHENDRQTAYYFGQRIAQLLLD
ncbi:flavodoxin family protein [Vibrio marisflavi]|uniref:Flavodoxin FldP n=1 Tax=Vibrio marisflavi CECT 7928 TaxID=634439 RepID=A0ABM9A7D6_9VIBR|nr:flavodoxin family protein [Vibrio marisflavi]CAH0541260.1 Flavodoxin FldP [Vibrio marisflavi CECT 7928]